MPQKLVVGLGNPGEEYALTRHNFGWLFLDSITDSPFKVFRKSQISVSCGSDSESQDLTNCKVIFCKPQTFMNRSGEAVKEVLAYYKLTAADMIVIHDDADLEFGDVRNKIGGSDAGHRGIRSIDESLGSREYRRIRMGIGRPENFRVPLDDYVLSKFTKSQQAEFPEIFRKTNLELEISLEGSR